MLSFTHPHVIPTQLTFNLYLDIFVVCPYSGSQWLQSCLVPNVLQNIRSIQIWKDMKVNK